MGWGAKSDPRLKGPSIASLTLPSSGLYFYLILFWTLNIEWRLDVIEGPEASFR